MVLDYFQNNYICCSYYTKNTLYEHEVERLRTSLKKFNILYDIQAINNLGEWIHNVNYKPTFIKKMMVKHPDKSIVYVDCDAEFLSYPNLFDEYVNDMKIDIAVHNFDKSCYGPAHAGKTEVLSGTIYLKNTSKVYSLIEKWEKECKHNPKKWDQKSLQSVLGDNFQELPAEYCKIFDKQKFVTHPVIVHYQASRKVRRNKGKLV